MQVATKVDEGVKQLVQAEKTQKQSRTILCIVFLLVAVIFMLCSARAKAGASCNLHDCDAYRCSPSSIIQARQTLSPAHSALKFSTVFGKALPNKPKTNLPSGSPSTAVSKKVLWVTVASAGGVG